MSASTSKLPGKVVSVIQLIEDAEEKEFFTTLPSKCEDILQSSGGETVKFEHLDINGNHISTHGFVFLYAEKEKPTEDDFMQIELKTKSKAVTMIIRKDNLYLIGFFSSRGYFELKSREGDRLLPNATLLKNVDVNYTSLLNINVVEEGFDEMCTKFSVERLIGAIYALDSKNTLDRDLPHHIGMVVVMIIESIRSPKIMNAIINKGEVDEKKLTLSQLIDRITDWDKGSKAMCNYKNQLKRRRDNPLMDKEVELEMFATVDEAAEMIKAVHCTQERKLHAPAPTPSAGIKWNDTRKGESSSKKSKKKSKKK